MNYEQAVSQANSLLLRTFIILMENTVCALKYLRNEQLHLFFLLQLLVVIFSLIIKKQSIPSCSFISLSFYRPKVILDIGLKAKEIICQIENYLDRSILIWTGLN